VYRAVGPPPAQPVAQASAAQPQVVIQRPAYSSVGVPMQVATQPVSLDVPQLQKQVKCWSKFLVVVSWLLMISGVCKFL